jgi:tRNA wybutosine-synthesizing protein 2
MRLSVRVEDAGLLKRIKNQLEERQLFNKRAKIQKSSDGSYLIPTVCSERHQLDWITEGLVVTDDNQSGRMSSLEILNQLAVKYGIDPDELVTNFPCRWSVYPPLVLFGGSSHGWLVSKLSETGFFGELLNSGFFGVKNLTHIAENAPLGASDRVRRPFDLMPVFGDFGPEPMEWERPTMKDFESAFWCTCVQNGIFQTWAPRYTMFSRGNITEKARVLNSFKSQTCIEDTTVVDMYAGIGYFVFSYAKNKPRRIFCWELNPWSVEGLVRGAKVNDWNVRVLQSHEDFQSREDDFIIVFLEDNKKALERLQKAQIDNVSHINLGLLPDSRLAWKDAAIIARGSTCSCIVHVHENVDAKKLDEWKEEVVEALGDNAKMLHLEVIKSFAPGVYHVCGDVQLESVNCI